MKAGIRITLLIFAWMHVLALFTSVSAEEVKLPSPVGAWNLTEGEGKIVPDVSGNGRDAEFGDDETGWIQDFEGKFDQVVTPGYIKIDNSDGRFDASEDFTFAAWLYVSENHTGWGMIANHVSSNANAQWDLHINTEGDLALEAQGVWGMNGLFIIKQNFVQEPKWRHIAVTYKKDAQAFEVFIDGEPFKEILQYGNKVDPAKAEKPIEPPSGNSTLKLLGIDTGFNNLIGRLAQVRFYDQTLNEAQVKLLMEGDNLSSAAVASPEAEASAEPDGTPAPSETQASEASASPAASEEPTGTATPAASDAASAVDGESGNSIGLYVGIALVAVILAGVLTVILRKNKKSK